jgi:hypothetical protein
MSNFNIGALRQLPPATFFADFRNGYTNEMVRLNTTRSTTVSTRVNNSGLIETVGANIPRLDYDPVTKAVKGLLVEPAAENKCLQSEDFTTSWGLQEVTITTNDTTAPDGNSTADKLADNAVNQRHRVNQPISFTSGVTYTFSVFVKKDSSGRFLLLNAATAFNARAAVNLDTLAVTDINGTGGSLETYPNGWYRFSVTGTATSTATVDVFVQMQDSAADNLYVGDGSSFYIWGAQVETGPIATSYIPTTTIALTRNADQIALTSASSLIGQTEGTLYVEVDWRGTDGASQFLLSINNDSNNRLAIFVASNIDLRMFARSNSVTLTEQGESVTGYSGTQKIAFAYKTDDFELYRNGTSVSTDTAGSLSALATLTNIDLGQNNGASGQANMHIRSVALFKKRLTDQQLQALTGN